MQINLATNISVTGNVKHSAKNNVKSRAENNIANVQPYCGHHNGIACFFAVLLFAVTACVAAPCRAQHIESDERPAFQPSAYVTWTSDYVYRGVSLTGSDPTWQGGADIAHRSGLFAGVWTSAIAFSPPVGPNTEHNVFAGYSRDFGMSWSGGVRYTRFDFRGGKVGPDNAFDQWQIDVQYNKATSLRVYQADNTYGMRFASTVVEMQHVVPIADNWLLSGLFGQWDLEKLSGDHYNYIELGGSWSVQRFSVALKYHHADSRGRKVYLDAANPGWLVSTTYRMF